MEGERNGVGTEVDLTEHWHSWREGGEGSDFGQKKNTFRKHKWVSERHQLDWVDRWRIGLKGERKRDREREGIRMEERKREGKWRREITKHRKKERNGESNIFSRYAEFQNISCFISEWEESLADISHSLQCVLWLQAPLKKCWPTEVYRNMAFLFSSINNKVPQLLWLEISPLANSQNANTDA